MYHYQENIVDSNGTALNGWSIGLYAVGGDPETAPAITIYSDRAGTTAIPGGLVRSVAKGFVEFYVPSGAYSRRYYNAKGVYQYAITDSDMDTTGGNLASTGGAALVGLAQGGDVQDALGFLTLEMFGGVPDGVTDCSPAMTAALAVLSLGVIGDRARRRRIVLNSGQYRFTSQISIGFLTDFSMVGPGAELCSLLIDHTSGHGILYQGNSNAEFSGFTIYASDTRYAAAANDALCGFVADPGATGVANANGGIGVIKTVLGLRMRDVFSYRHPGMGIQLINPELAYIADCRPSLNKGRGIYMYGRDVANINNELHRVRSRSNGGTGIDWENLNNGLISGCEGLNNTTTLQMRVNGASNRIDRPDLEAFDLVTGVSDYRGLLIAGRKNRVFGGAFYALNMGIQLSNADETVIENPNIYGKSGTAMATGISVGSGSDDNIFVYGLMTDVTTPLANSGLRNTVIQQGQVTLPSSAVTRVVSTYAASFTPDLSTGSYFVITLTGNITINAPANMRSGQDIIFEFIQDATGGRTVTWNGAWRQTWSDTGNTANRFSIIKFRSRGTGSAIQEGTTNAYYA